MTTRARHHAQRGLSLVELLIALGIFAAVSAAAIGLMALAASGEARVAQVSKELASLERARGLIRMDMMQVIDRPYREPFEVEATPTFAGGVRGASLFEEQDGERVLVAFVRQGWVNPGGAQPRSSLQRVAYIATDDTLIRRVRPYLDATPETPLRDQVLFENVEGIDLSFLGVQDWEEDWISVERRVAPRAIRLQMIHPTYGDLVQDFIVGGPGEF